VSGIAKVTTRRANSCRLNSASSGWNDPSGARNLRNRWPHRSDVSTGNRNRSNNAQPRANREPPTLSDPTTQASATEATTIADTIEAEAAIASRAKIVDEAMDVGVIATRG
jgi:hypothetical protein